MGAWRVDVGSARRLHEADCWLELTLQAERGQLDLITIDDSWEDGAEVRDVATGRIVDLDRLHDIDFSGEWFAILEVGPTVFTCSLPASLAAGRRRLVGCCEVRI